MWDLELFSKIRLHIYLTMVLVGLIAGRPAVQQAVRQNTGRFLKLPTDRIVRIFMAFNEGAALL